MDYDTMVMETLVVLVDEEGDLYSEAFPDCGASVGIGGDLTITHLRSEEVQASFPPEKWVSTTTVKPIQR